jgi:conjugative transfer signal peptidase TraF
MKRHRALIAAWSVSLLMLALLAGGVCAGLRLNTTRSIPPGVYRVTGELPRPGAYVMACPPPQPVFLEARARGYIGPGNCSGDMGLLMKLVAAGPGDRIELTEAAVVVNGHALPGSARVRIDPSGRPLPQPASTSATLGDEVLLMGDVNPRSFDSRYFGPIDRAQIRAVIRPVFTY